MTELPERVARLKDVSNGAFRTQARTELIADVWLRQMLPETAWVAVRSTPTFLLKELYPDVWLLGPNAVEFKTFWRALRQLLLQDANASRFTQFEQDALDTYKDYDLTGAYEARRHTYFDVRHAYAWGQFMQMGWIDNKMQQSLFGSILDLESDGYRRRMFAGSLGLMSLVIISQGIPNTVDVDRWAALQAKHDQFCDRWGLPRLGLLPDFVSEA